MVLQTSAHPLVWIVRGIDGGLWLWPASCGDPEAFIRTPAPGTAGPCYELIAADQLGQTTTAGPFCLPDSRLANKTSGTKTIAAAGGCSLSATRESDHGLWFGVASLVFLARRRTSRLC